MAVPATSAPPITPARAPSVPRDLWLRFRKNKLAVAGAAVLAVLVLAAVLAPWLAPYNPLTQDYAVTLQPPGGGHWFGTDELGRDVLSRVMYGARSSLAAGVISVGIAVAVGLPIGLISGFYRGFWDEVVIMRITDALQAVPFLILALALAAVLGPGLGKAMIAIGIGFTPAVIRVVRGQVLAQREQDYVQAARALGAGDLRIMFRHVLPNIVGPVIVQASLATASAIIAEASLSYLGLGIQPPAPAWGSTLRFAQGYLTIAPWMAYWPGIAIFVTVMSINLLGDGLRDMLDPKMKS
ncbi:MAG: binding-protein-dependent transport system inner rane component [Firmicutes bacterium]|nr:binding-protein-dependent transport system inner rane component [Bacillota bacterium]